MTINTIQRRRGSVLPMLAVSIIVLFMFVALAIDIGMLMVARAGCQHAADAAALNATRMLDNKPMGAGYNNNRDAAIANALATVNVQNPVLTQTGTIDTPRRYTTTTDIRVGIYDYNVGAQEFEDTYPSALPAGKSWTCVEARVNSNEPVYFSRILGFTSMPTNAIATAAHRPRDLAVVLDMSGSMKFSSTFQWDPGTAGSNGNTSGTLSPDPRYPQFGHFSRYNPTVTPNAFRRTTTFLSGSLELFAPANYTIDTPAGPAMVQQFRYVPSAMGAQVTTVASESALQNAFQRWTPPQLTAGNVNSYTPPTFNWNGYNAFAGFNTGATNGPIPAPDNFATQADDAGAAYVGDRFPRKAGIIRTDNTSWLPSTTTGAAETAWQLLFPASVAAAPTLSASTWRTIPTTRPGGGISAWNSTTNTAFTSWREGGSNWSNYIDHAWEQFGYDLNIDTYITSSLTPTSPSVTRAGGSPFSTAGRFKGYSMGPAWYGKTFFMWPPDPRWGGGVGATRPDQVSATDTAKDTGGNWICDWRRRFFLRGTSADTGTPTSYLYFDPAIDNDPNVTGTQNINQTLLRSTSGHVLRDSMNGSNRNFRINYRAILAWLKSGPQVLPPNLRAGRIKYYTSIPDDVDGAASPGSDETLLDKRFWREYIDYVLGYTANNGNYDPRYTLAGVESSAWVNAVSINATTQHSYPNPTNTTQTILHPLPSMNYLDNPNRPRMHFWFGPKTLMAFIASRMGSGSLRNWMAGTAAEAQTWQLKAGVRSALDDIRNNHPNDQVGVTFFAGTMYQTVRSRMGQDWDNHKNSLYYPFSLLANVKANGNNEVRPYNSGFGDSLGGNLPNANGSTDPVSGFALAYNLLSSASGIPDIGTGTGRRGASKVVVFETDGVPNSYRQFNFTAGGVNSYYSPTNTAGGTSASDAQSRAYAVIDQIVAPTTSNGFSLPNSPARVFPIAFGDLFGSTSSLKTTALNFLQEVAFRGRTSPNSSEPLPPYQVIIGTADERREALRNAFERIMQSGVQVTLVK